MRNHAAQLAIIKQLSRQELHSTAGNCQADDRQESCSSAGNCQADEHIYAHFLERFFSFFLNHKLVLNFVKHLFSVEELVDTLLVGV